MSCLLIFKGSIGSNHISFTNTKRMVQKLFSFDFWNTSISYNSKETYTISSQLVFGGANEIRSGSIANFETICFQQK